MHRMDLVRFLAESAADLLDETSMTEAQRQERMDEAAELLNLGTKMLNRAAVAEGNVLQEAA